MSSEVCSKDRIWPREVGLRRMFIEGKAAGVRKAVDIREITA